MKIIHTVEDDTRHAEYMAIQREELTRGKLTVRWLQSTASCHIFSGNRRPAGIGGFENEDLAAEWLEEEHGLTL